MIMKLKIGDILIAKKSFKNTNTTNNFFLKDKKYTVRISHFILRKINDDKNPFRSVDYVIVNDLPGYDFLTEYIYKDRDNYIWNCFYTPSEIRKIKLLKIKQNV